MAYGLTFPVVVYVYTKDLGFVITVPADGLARNGSRPSAGAVLIKM